MCADPMNSAFICRENMCCSRQGYASMNVILLEEVLLCTSEQYKCNYSYNAGIDIIVPCNVREIEIY